MNSYVIVPQSWSEHTPERVDQLAAQLSAAVGHGDVSVEALRLEDVSAAAPGTGWQQQSRPDWLPSTIEAAIFVSSPALAALGDTAALELVGAQIPTAAGWTIRRHIMLDLADARERPSIARFGFLSRPAGLDVAGFGDHWRRQHAPLVVRNGPLFRRYEANLAVAVDEPLPWDGLVIQWFADRADWDRHDELIATVKTEVREDIPRFVGGAHQFLASDLLTAGSEQQER